MTEGSQDTPSQMLEANVAAELRIVLTAGRSLTALRALELPRLDGLLEAIGCSRDDLPDYLASAIDKLDDRLYRAAAQDLFPLPYQDDAGWLKLSARAKAAAGRFNVGYDGFRRAGPDRPSRLDQVVGQVAESLVSELQTDSGRAGPGDVIDQASLASNASESTNQPPSSSTESEADNNNGRGTSRSRRWLIVPIAGVLLFAFAAVAIWLWPGNHHSTKANGQAGGASFRPPGCAGTIGQLDGQLRQEPQAAGLRHRLAVVYRQTAATSALGCPTGPAYRWQSLVVQELTNNSLPNGALIISPDGSDLYFNRAAFGSYHQLGGKTGTVAQSTGGLPLRIVSYQDGHQEIELSAGTILVAEAPDAPYFWIPAAYVARWRDHPELGLPTSNPEASLRQEFQHGFASFDPTQPNGLRLTLVDHPEAELPTLGTITGHILTQADGTAWFISQGGQRQWIPDGATWSYLGGDNQRVAPDLPGYVIDTLPYGGEARCPG